MTVGLSRRYVIQVLADRLLLFRFLPRDATLESAIAMASRLSVRSSVSPSVALADCDVITYNYRAPRARPD